MKQTLRLTLYIIGILGIWLWAVISVCKPTRQPVSYYAPDYVESYTVGSFDQLQIEKVYCLDPEDSPDRISVEDFQAYGRYFALLELEKESTAGADIYTAVFRETGPAS